MTQNFNTSKIILSAVIVFTSIIGIFIFFHPPAVYPDPSWGFRVLHCMQYGGPFNVLISPSTADILHNDYGFLSWWSPGQYLVPYLIISLLPVTLAHGTVIAIVSCSLIGLWGLYNFYKQVGFSTQITIISIAFIFCQQFYVMPFVFYNGGEIVLFAFVGWFLYGCTRLDKPGWRSVMFILLSGLIGFFCKSSFLWIYFSGVLYWWLKSASNKFIIRKWIVNGFWAALPAIACVAIIFLCYLSKGDNPAASTDGGLNLGWETFSYPMAAPLLAGFSIDEITNGLNFNHASIPVLHISWTVIVMLVLALASLALVITAVKQIPSAKYKLLLSIFYMVCILFFGINFLRHASISFEARHMRIIGLIIVPAVFYLLQTKDIIYKILFGLAWLYITFTSVVLLTNGYRRDGSYSAHGATGFSQIFIDQPTLNYVNQLDAHEHNAIFIFNTPDAALEIQRNRVITFEPLNDNLKAENELAEYSGHAGKLYLILPKTYFGPKAEVYMKCFPGYKNFGILYQSQQYVIYAAK